MRNKIYSISRRSNGDILVSENNRMIPINVLSKAKTYTHAIRIYKQKEKLLYSMLYLMNVKKDEIELIYRAINGYYKRLGFLQTKNYENYIYTRKYSSEEIILFMGTSKYNGIAFIHYNNRILIGK